MRHTTPAAPRPPRPHRHRPRDHPAAPAPGPTPTAPAAPPQSGHASSPPASRRSTQAASAPTVSTAPPRATRPSRDASAKRYREGLRMPSSARCRRQRTRPPATAHTKIRRHTACRNPPQHISNLSAAQQSEPRSRSPGGSSASGQSEQAPLNAKSLLLVEVDIPVAGRSGWSPATAGCPVPAGARGRLVPSRVACACTVNRTVALRFPAGCADTIRNEVTVILGPVPRRERTHDRWAGGTVCAAARRVVAPECRPERARRPVRRQPPGRPTAFRTPEGESRRRWPVPSTTGPLLISCDMLAICAAGGAETRTGTPKS